MLHATAVQKKGAINLPKIRLPTALMKQIVDPLAAPQEHI